jgi:hypothetical protein
MTTWPTGWNPHDLDIIPIDSISGELSCYTLIIPERELVLMKKVWIGNDFMETRFDGKVKPVIEQANLSGGYLVTVDYHC